MQRTIIESIQQPDSKWLTQLSCGHSLHLHNAAVPAEPLDCDACERFELPVQFIAYKQTPMFNEATVPAGILNNHSTKAGVWAKIHVVDGRLRYRVPALNTDQELAAGQIGIVVPEVVHNVQPLGTVSFYVEFYRAG